MSYPDELADRFWAYVAEDVATGCWLWTGALAGAGEHRYGRIYVDGRNVPAHRVAYELVVGVIRPGLEIDHLCRIPRCVNPAHLDPVTHRENMRRGRSHWRERTHCPEGHPYDEANTRIRPDGGRECRACSRIRGREWDRAVPKLTDHQRRIVRALQAGRVTEDDMRAMGITRVSAVVRGLLASNLARRVEPGVSHTIPRPPARRFVTPWEVTDGE